MKLPEMTDEQLDARLRSLIAREREAVAEVVACLAEADLRRLFPLRGYASLFEYAHRSLGYSEGAAYRRIRAARAIQMRPEALEMLRQGEISLEGLALLNPLLDRPDGKELLARAAGLSKRKVEELVCVATGVRLPERDIVKVGAAPPASGAESDLGTPSLDFAGAATRVAASEALDPARLSPSAAPFQDGGSSSPMIEARAVRFAFTADDEFLSLLRRAQSILRHKYPNGRLGGVLRDALKALLAKRDPLFRIRLGKDS